MTVPTFLLVVSTVLAAGAPPPPTEADARARFGKNVVLLGSRDDAAHGFSARGTGVLVAPGIVVTLRAPYETSDEPPAWFAVDGDGNALPAEPLDVADPDLLLLRVPGLDGPALAFAPRAPAVGAAVFVVGAAVLDAPRATRGIVTDLKDDTGPLRVDAVLPPGGAGGLVVDAALAPFALATGTGVVEGEPVTLTLDGRRIAALVKKIKPAKAKPSKPSSSSSSSSLRVGVPTLVAPVSVDAERLQKLSDATLADALAGPPDRRIETLLAAIAWNPHSPGPWVRLARILDEAGRFEEAQGAYEATAALRQEYRVDSCALAALALQKGGRYAAAERGARRCLLETPRHPLSLAVAASARAGLGDFKAAVPELKQALALDPSLGWVHGVLGAALASQGKLDDAIAEYRKAVVAAPTNTGLRMALGEALVQKGALKDAVVVYRGGPADPAQLARLGELLIASGNPTEARKVIDKALALDPKNEQAQATLLKLKSAKPK